MEDDGKELFSLCSCNCIHSMLANLSPYQRCHNVSIKHPTLDKHFVTKFKVTNARESRWKLCDKVFVQSRNIV